MINWIKKHTKLCILIILAFTLVLPLGINTLYLINTDCTILHAPSAWTIFWCGYLGYIISPAAAFIILYIQRQDSAKHNNDNKSENEKQNEKNRIENEKQNEANKKLQLKIMLYQQQSHWLDNFRDASLEYCHAFNYNDVIMISNIAWNNPDEAFDIIKKLFDRIATTNAKFSFVRKQDNEANKLVEYIDQTYKAYKQILNYLQWIVLYYKSEIPANRLQQRFYMFLKHQVNANNDTDHILQLIILPTAYNNNWDYFNTLVLDIAAKAIRYEANIREKLYEYIKQEQERINSILTQDL